jgi:hypothetical protein
VPVVIVPTDVPFNKSVPVEEVPAEVIVIKNVVVIPLTPDVIVVELRPDNEKDIEGVEGLQ